MENNTGNLNMQEIYAQTMREQQPVPQPVQAPVLPEGSLSQQPVQDQYQGGGLVIDPNEFQAKEEAVVMSTAGAGEDSVGSIMDRLNEMDEQIAEVEIAKAEREKAEAINNEEDEDDYLEEDSEENEELDNEEKKAKYLKKYAEAVIVMDKSQMGTVIFTDEEREKMEIVKKIKVEEVESLSLETIKTKKVKPGKIAKILQRQKNVMRNTTIVLPMSGYTAVIKGCSTYELLELISDSKNILVDNETKWTLIYNKIESTSIGKFKDFADFLSHTAHGDYQTFIYGILCATYPDIDTMPLNCQKCKKEFDHSYSIKSLIRVEQMADHLQEQVAAVVDASHMLETAKEHHEASPVNTVKRYKLPQSEIIVDLYIQSVNDFIYKSIKKLSTKKETKYAQASVLSTAVSAFYIPEEDGTYLEIREPEDITEVIYELQDTDIMILNKKMDELISNKSIEYGLMDITCPHCDNYTPAIPLDTESILFFKYQQALNTNVE